MWRNVRAALLEHLSIHPVSEEALRYLEAIGQIPEYWTESTKQQRAMWKAEAGLLLDRANRFLAREIDGFRWIDPRER